MGRCSPTWTPPTPMINPKEDPQVKFLQLCCCSSNCLVSSLVNKLKLDPTKIFHLLLNHLLTIRIKLHHPQLNSKHLLLLINRISSAQTVPDPEEDKMIVDNIWRT